MEKACGKYMEIYENIRKYMKIDIVDDFAFILYVLT